MQSFQLLNNVTGIGPGTSARTSGIYKTLQAIGTTTTGIGSATINIEVSNDSINWLVHDTITLTLSTVVAVAGIEMNSPWMFVRGNIITTSGTGATVSLTMVV